MALVLNQEQQMLKESAQGFLSEFASITELWIWGGLQYWCPKTMAGWALGRSGWAR